VPEEILNILLDQNIPQAVSGWLKGKLSDCKITHVNELGFQGRTDEYPLPMGAEK
jgi:predicted nuclease of predicted toxin-antitoxin system